MAGLKKQLPILNNDSHKNETSASNSSLSTTKHLKVNHKDSKKMCIPNSIRSKLLVITSKELKEKKEFFQSDFQREFRVFNKLTVNSSDMKLSNFREGIEIDISGPRKALSGLCPLTKLNMKSLFSSNHVFHICDRSSSINVRKVYADRLSCLSENIRFGSTGSLNDFSFLHHRKLSREEVRKEPLLSYNLTKDFQDLDIKPKADSIPNIQNQQLRKTESLIKNNSQSIIRLIPCGVRRKHVIKK